MRCKILKTIQKVCDILELLVAVLVAAGLICSLILYLPVGLELLLKSGNTAEFLIFLEDMFSLVVGIEFIKMLCRPSADNVIEVMIFLTARHMIVAEAHPWIFSSQCSAWPCSTACATACV